ncbi:AAA family ATPase [Hippea maritima]|uniref:AAA ATPase n=1 Tax=Hippea maritima (strain ATCC 700847 / DSM 10411 / MH2) TaxID=760142 RepID=F2LUF2_HIPMA|nr:AAA family ATPase [Hippea maritima]AEA33478.1 AAA ATPase [Hippea maritima DSM 10411]
MVKKTSIYVCSNCGYTSSKWYGRCPNCGEWGTFEEKTGNDKKKSRALDYKKPVKISQVNYSESFLSFDGDFSSLFNNKLSLGGVYLISGTPGVGKSTLLLQLAGSLSKNGRVVYISAEESLGQIASRGERLSVGDVELVSENELNRIIAMLEVERPTIAIVDSVHTIFDSDLDYTTGGIQQVRHCAEKLTEAAKRFSITLFIVAHITKSGAIAGPKTLEHMVDSVLLLQAESKSGFRVLKFLKNRFGSTDEALILQMTEKGLVEVKDPTIKFIDGFNLTDGVCYGAIAEGKHPILIEVQALCVQTPLAIPRRISVGFDINRLNMLIAVIEKRVNLPMFKYDVYVNITGGIKVSSTLMDAAVVGAIFSSFKKKSFLEKSVVFSEIDLSGRLRLFESDKAIVDKLKASGFSVMSALNTKDVKRLYDSV